MPRLTYAAFRRALAPAVRRLYRLEVEGAARLPGHGPTIVVANHESMLDPIILGCAIDRDLRFLAMAELWRFRLLA